MPYNNKNKQREYQREWADRKRHGLPTKIVNKPKLTTERRREQKRMAGIRLREKKRSLINEIFPKECKMCGRIKRIMVLHQKDGKQHDRFIHMPLDKLRHVLEHEADNFVRLCYGCHKHIHWCMKYLGMTRIDIEHFL